MIPTDDMVVLARPHFKLRDGGLYFLLSTRPHAELDTNEAALWAMLDGVATIGQLEQRQPGAKVRLERFWNLEICEFAAGSFPANRRRILVIEPHMDDAILSVGGLMWSLRESCEFILVTAGGRSNFTSYYMLEREFFDVATVSRLRNAESALVMRLLGGQHIDLGLSEAPLRYHDGNWTLDWFNRHRNSIGGFIGHSGTDEEIESWTDAIEQMVRASDFDEIWMPLGIGSHVDHELTRNACLRLLTNNRTLATQAEVSFYQDVPYAIDFPHHTSQVLRALTDSGAILRKRLADISEDFDAKLRLLSIYGSQFKLSFMAPRVDSAARQTAPSGNGRFECLYRLARPPSAVESFDVYSGRSIVEELRVRMVPWYTRNRLSQRIRVLAPISIGHWAEDLTLLLESFPLATLEVHVSADNIAETEQLISARIEVRQVQASARSWMGRLLTLTVSKPCPMILLPGETRGASGRAAKIICPLSDILVATRMTHLALALKRAVHAASTS